MTVGIAVNAEEGSEILMSVYHVKSAELNYFIIAGRAREIFENPFIDLRDIMSVDGRLVSLASILLRVGK